MLDAEPWNVRTVLNANEQLEGAADLMVAENVTDLLESHSSTWSRRLLSDCPGNAEAHTDFEAFSIEASSNPDRAWFRDPNNAVSVNSSDL